MSASFHLPGTAVAPWLRTFLLTACLSWSACLCSASATTPEEVQAQVARADALRQEGKFPEARKIYESVLPGLRPNPSKELGDALIGLSEIAIAQGRYDAAVTLAHESAGVYQTLGDADGAAKARNNAGWASMNAGNYPDAATELSSALRQSNRTRTSVLILNNLGSVYYYQAKYAESFRAYDDAMRRLEHAEDTAAVPFLRKATLFNLAVLYQRLGDEQRALTVYRELQQSLSDLAPREVGLLYANLGVLYRHLGDPQKALETYQKAEHLYETEHDVEGELVVRMDIGILLAFDLARPNESLKVFTDVRTRAEKAKNQRAAMQALLYQGQALYRMGSLSDAKSKFEKALAEASNLGTTEEQWKALYALGRIAEKNNQSGLAETEYREAISTIESIRSKIQLAPLKSGFLADKRDVYDAIISLLVRRNDSAAAFGYMERSRARVFQDRFSGTQGAPAAISLRSIQDRLDQSTALVEFWVSADMMAAVWITKDSTGLAQRQLTSADAQELMRLVGHLPDSLGENWEANVARLNALLPEHLVPFAESRYRHLLVVPDGFLSLVPFDLLSVDRGKPLLESYDFTYLPSAALLLRSPLPRADRIRLPWEQQLVAFGDPAIGLAGDSVVAVDDKALGQLPGSADEIRRIAAMSNGRATTFLGAADRKQAFIDASRLGAALLHVSTHAVADLDNPERSRLLFAPEQSARGNDFLFLKELYDVNLQGVNLAVLSACDTEQGKLVPGEGIQSFSRALLASGARSALTTLWRVPDQPTTQFVNRFYFFLLKKHKPKAEALRLAKLEFLHSRTSLSHPRYWAAFVLNGEGNKAVPTYLAWQAVLLPIPLAVVLTAVVWHFWQRRNRFSRRAEKVRATAGGTAIS